MEENQFVIFQEAGPTADEIQVVNTEYEHEEPDVNREDVQEEPDVNREDVQEEPDVNREDVQEEQDVKTEDALEETGVGTGKMLKKSDVITGYDQEESDVNTEDVLDEADVNTEDVLDEPDVNTEDDLDEPDVKTEDDLDEPDVKTEDDLDEPDVKTEDDLDEPDVKTEDDLDEPDVKTEDDLDEPDVKTEDDLDEPDVKTDVLDEPDVNTVDVLDDFDVNTEDVLDDPDVNTEDIQGDVDSQTQCHSISSQSDQNEHVGTHCRPHYSQRCLDISLLRSKTEQGGNTSIPVIEALKIGNHVSPSADHVATTEDHNVTQSDVAITQNDIRTEGDLTRTDDDVTGTVVGQTRKGDYMTRLYGSHFDVSSGEGDQCRIVTSTREGTKSDYDVMVSKMVKNSDEDFARTHTVIGTHNETGTNGVLRNDETLMRVRMHEDDIQIDDQMSKTDHTCTVKCKMKILHDKPISDMIEDHGTHNLPEWRISSDYGNESSHMSLVQNSEKDVTNCVSDIIIEAQNTPNAVPLLCTPGDFDVMMSVLGDSYADSRLTDCCISDVNNKPNEMENHIVSSHNLTSDPPEEERLDEAAGISRKSVDHRETVNPICAQVNTLLSPVEQFEHSEYEEEKDSVNVDSLRDLNDQQHETRKQQLELETDKHYERIEEPVHPAVPSLRAKKRKKQRAKLDKRLANQPCNNDKGKKFASSFKELVRRFETTEFHPDFTCSVCLDLFHKPHIVSPCEHMFCEPCLRKLPSSALADNAVCPLCRSDIELCTLDVDLHLQLSSFYADLYQRRAKQERKLRTNQNPLPRITPTPLSTQIIRQMFRRSGTDVRRQHNNSLTVCLSVCLSVVLCVMYTWLNIPIEITAGPLRNAAVSNIWVQAVLMFFVLTWFFHKLLSTFAIR